MKPQIGNVPICIHTDLSHLKRVTPKMHLISMKSIFYVPLQFFFGVENSHKLKQFPLYLKTKAIWNDQKSITWKWCVPVLTLNWQKEKKEIYLRYRKKQKLRWMLYRLYRDRLDVFIVSFFISYRRFTHWIKKGRS